MLVQPYIDTAGNPNFRPYLLHASGISWYGNYLYVSNGSTGLEIFDMRKIWRVDDTGSGIGRQPDGSYESAGYKYVLPSVGTVRNAGSSPLEWSTLGLDRAQLSLVTTGWIETSAPGRRTLPLDSATQTFKPGADGLVHATQALNYTYVHVQGAVSHNGRWWLEPAHLWACTTGSRAPPPACSSGRAGPRPLLLGGRDKPRPTVDGDRGARQARGRRRRTVPIFLRARDHGLNTPVAWPTGHLISHSDIKEGPVRLIGQALFPGGRYWV